MYPYPVGFRVWGNWTKSVSFPSPFGRISSPTLGDSIGIGINDKDVTQSRSLKDCSAYTYGNIPVRRAFHEFLFEDVRNR